MTTATVTELPTEGVKSVKSVKVIRHTRTRASGKPTKAQRQAGDRKLATSVRNAYNRWVVFHSDYAVAQSVTMTMFTFHTWIWDIADFTPYIQVTAPTSEAGKSRVFDVAKGLVRRAFVVVDPTPAAIFNVIDLIRPTLLIDEADMLRESKQLRAILNSGFQPGTPIVRAKKVYDCFVPKMFSGISGDKPPLTEATASRTITLTIRRKSAREKVDRFIPREAAKILAPIQNDLQIWALRARDEVAEIIPENLPKELTDRQRDMWSPLFAIADYIGGTWPKMIREAAVILSKAIPKAPDPAVQILSDVKRVLDDYSGNRIPSVKLAELRNILPAKQYEDVLTSQQLGRRLSGFGIYSDPGQFRDGKGRSAPVVKGYTFRVNGKYAPHWRDAFERYRV